VIPLEKSETTEIQNKINTKENNDVTKEPPLIKSSVSQEMPISSDEKPSLFDMISKMQEKLINQTNTMTSSSSTLAQIQLNNLNVQKGSKIKF